VPCRISSNRRVRRIWAAPKGGHPVLANVGAEAVGTTKLILAVGLIIVGNSTVAWMDDGRVASEGCSGFVKLYNERDLSGWDVQGGKIESWAADGELLSCVGANGGWLRTSREYSDFVVKLEYRIPEGGNSGVGLRFPPTGDPAHAGMEIQILDDDAAVFRGIKPAQHTGSIYYQAPASKRAANPPGEWNAYEITCAGPHVRVNLNGQVINDAMVDTFTTAQGNHTPLAERPRIGYVGLQSHGSRVDFRNILLRDLTHTTPGGVKYVDVTQGSGRCASSNSTISVRYSGRLLHGKEFINTVGLDQPKVFSLCRLIHGWREGIPGMRAGGRRQLIIPAEQAYGERGFGDRVPADATLIFDVELIAVR